MTQAFEHGGVDRLLGGEDAVPGGMTGTGDTIIPVSCSTDVEKCFGTDDYTEAAGPAGHIGTFVGGKAQKILAPTLAEWFKARSD